MSNPVTIITEIKKYNISAVNQKYNIAAESLKYNIVTESVSPTRTGIGYMIIGSTFIVG